MQIQEIFHKKISFKLIDATLFYVSSIVIFSFFTYVLAMWQFFYDKQSDLQVVSNQNPGVALVTLKQEVEGVSGVVKGNKARFVLGDNIIIPNQEGRFVLPLKGG